MKPKKKKKTYKEKYLDANKIIKDLNYKILILNDEIKNLEKRVEKKEGDIVSLTMQFANYLDKDIENFLEKYVTKKLKWSKK